MQVSLPPWIPQELLVPKGVDSLLRAAPAVEPEERPPTAQASAEGLLSPGAGPRAPHGSRRSTRRAAVRLFVATALLAWFLS